MPYVHITTSPGKDLAGYHAVQAKLGSEPVAGQIARYAGMVSGSLVVVDVWASRADADRFAAERLFPAFAAAGIAPTSDTTIVAFEAVSEEETAGV